MVPVITELSEKMGDQPTTGVKQEDPQYGGNGGSHGIRQQHQGLIETAAAHDVLHQRREEQRHQQTADGDKGAEFYRRPEGVEILAVMKQSDYVIQTDNLAGETKRIQAL